MYIPQMNDDVLAGADEQQAAMMAERVILIDDNDNVIGHASKKECEYRRARLPFQPYKRLAVSATLTSPLTTFPSQPIY
jgi:hypothetical protein